MIHTFGPPPSSALSVAPRPRVRRDPAGHWRVLVSGMPEWTFRYDTWDRAMEAALAVARSLRNLPPPSPSTVLPWTPVPLPSEPPTQPLPPLRPPAQPQAWWESRRPA